MLRDILYGKHANNLSFGFYPGLVAILPDKLHMLNASILEVLQSQTKSVTIENMMPARPKSSRKTGTLHQSQLPVVTTVLTQDQCFPDELQCIFPR
ncbi:hypothetical protein PCANC_08778 [Puccinia coronata f. sp. avenae]|uniref:Uncharacterized protein n=1 Tax=Puccinia coronata f. sp. avenae TaxID=200324 RepID=A0A2N5T1U4_9BASI|nr:hypothetical protein PCANC_08778 [Puccinia coronata f. sp. avenae]